MLCQRCGKEIGNQSLCPVCGMEQTANAIPMPSVNQEAPQPASQPPIQQPPVQQHNFNSQNNVQWNGQPQPQWGNQQNITQQNTQWNNPTSPYNAPQPNPYGQMPSYEPYQEPVLEEDIGHWKIARIMNIIAAWGFIGVGLLIGFCWMVIFSSYGSVGSLGGLISTAVLLIFFLPWIIGNFVMASKVKKCMETRTQPSTGLKVCEFILGNIISGIMVVM